MSTVPCTYCFGRGCHRIVGRDDATICPKCGGFGITPKPTQENAMSTPVYPPGRVRCGACFGKGAYHIVGRGDESFTCTDCKGAGSVPNPTQENAMSTPVYPPGMTMCFGCQGTGSCLLTREHTTERAACTKCKGSGSVPSVAPDLIQSIFLHEVWQEFKIATIKFPATGNPTALALAEEAGEVAKALLQEPSARVKRECIQLAAMAMRVALQGDETVAPWREAHKLDHHPEPWP